MNDQNERPLATVRTLELVVAGLLFLLGAVVVFDSVRLGAKWADDGPQAGYFPFYVDLMKRVRALPEWQDFMERGAFNQTALIGDEYRAWVAQEEKRHHGLMKEAGFLAPGK